MWQGAPNMMLVGPEMLSPSSVYLAKKIIFIKILLVVLYMMLGDHIVRIIEATYHYLIF